MNLRRVGVLLKREFVYGPKNMMFTFAIVVPVLLSLIVSLLLGTLFSGKPKLGIVDGGQSQIVAGLEGENYLVNRRYATVDDLTRDVEVGALDMGLVLPAGFDAAIHQGTKTILDIYIWGESLVKHRTVLIVAISNQIIALTGKDVPFDIVTTTLGDGESVPWGEQLFPFIVMITIFFGGSMIPASSLIEEKQKRTLRALVVTPASLGEIFLAKGLMGSIVSIVMGLAILALNQAFSAHPALLVLVLALSACLVVEIGLLLGALVKDISSLFTVVKGGGILLYMPLFVYLFPKIPQWIAKLFPTYYIIGPIIELSMRDGAWPDIAVDVFILIGLILALTAVVAAVIRKFARTEAY